MESTTSRPLHTVGTTLEADAEKQEKEKKKGPFVSHEQYKHRRQHTANGLDISCLTYFRIFPVIIK